MPNNQAHDPRVSTAGERVAQAVGLSVAAVASGGMSGGTAALAWEALAGNLDHGSHVRLTTDGSFDFGTRIRPAPYLWWFGEECYIKGVPYDFISGLADGDPVPTNDAFNTNAFSSTVKVSRARSWRHNRLAAHMFANGHGGGFIGRILPTHGETVGPSVPSKLFVSFWLRLGINQVGTAIAKVASVTGAPDFGAEPLDADGERFTVSGGTHNGVTGYLAAQIVDPPNMEAGTYIVVEMHGTFNSGTFEGSTLICDSGAEISMIADQVPGTTYSGLSSKHLRIDQDVAGPNVGHVTGAAGIAVTSINVDQLGNGSLYYSDDKEGIADPALPEPWDISDRYPKTRNIVTFVDYETGPYIRDYVHMDYKNREYCSAYEKYLAAGAPENTTDGLITIDQADQTVAPFVTNIGNEPDNETITNVDMDEIYIDRQARRVVLGDAAVWADVTTTEIQRGVAWASDDVTVALNWGSLSAGAAWFYFMDDQDQPINTSGVGV